MNIKARNSAISMHNHGTALVGQDRQLAYRLLCSATTVDPSMAQAWYALGNATADMKMMDAAVACFRRVLELPVGVLAGDCDTDLRAKALVNLGHRLLNAGRIEEAWEVSSEAIRVLEADPSLDQEGRAFAWTNMSLVLSIMGRVEESLGYARRAFELNQSPIIETGLAFAYLFAGRYAEGLRHFDARFAYKPELNSYISLPYERWRGGRVGTLLVMADAGMGDTLSFARFVTVAVGRVERLVFMVQQELVRLFVAAFAVWPGIEVVPQQPTYPAADAWCPVMGLPVAMGMTTGQIEGCPQGWSAPAGCGVGPENWPPDDGRFNIGIAYGGSPANDIDVHRSIPPALFLELYRVPGVQLYGLQVGDRVKELHEAGAAALIRDLSPWIRDVSDTVGLMRRLDLVMTCESFVGHLAGAIGAECWVLVSHKGGDFRCGRVGEKQLWYPRSRVFRQGSDAAWGPVFGRVVEALRERRDAQQQ